MSQTVADKESETQPASRSFLTNNPAVVLWRSIVGKKIVMAITGLILVGFVIGHVVGNLHVFEGEKKINDYAVFLREFGEPLFGESQLLWLARSILLASVILHIVAAYQLTMTNLAARPQNYQKRKSLTTTIAALTMRYSGVLLALFILFHILHLTFGYVGFSGDEFKGHAEVYHNIVTAFKNPYISLFYIVCMAALALHLDHGVWSMFQTLGLNTKRASKPLQLLSHALAVLVFVGFIVVPVAVLAGWVH